MALQRVKFSFRLIDRDQEITSQNVISFKFINYGETNVIINGQLTLPPAQAGQTPNFFEENIGAGETTAQGYKVVFKNVPNKKNILQVIEKIIVN
jgi:hypothetical protein